jgi:hypothetical protein
MEWKKPSEKLPPQGKKILYFLKGNIYVVQRFGKHWMPVPFHDSKFSFYKEKPTYWADIECPENYTGYIQVIVDRESYTLDELEKEKPEIYKRFIVDHAKSWKAK